MKIGIKPSFRSVPFLVLAFCLLTSVDGFAAPRAGAESGGPYSAGCKYLPLNGGGFGSCDVSRGCGKECARPGDVTTCKEKGTCSLGCACVFLNPPQSSMDERSGGALQAELATSLSQLRDKLDDPNEAIKDKKGLEELLINTLHGLSNM